MSTSTKEYIDLWKTSVQSKGYSILCIRPENGRFIATIRHPRLSIIRRVPIQRLVVNL